MNVLLVTTLVILTLSGLLKANPGIIHSRIINGYNATIGQFPWVVTIAGKSKSGATIFCNGALITNQTILTVAQCLDNVKRISIGLGSIKRDVPLIHMPSDNFIIHPEYDAATFANNIGIIRFSNTLSFTKFIRPVQLPTVIQEDDNFVNAIATLSGFGRLINTGVPSIRLQFTKVKVVPEKQCQMMYGSRIVTSNTLCTVGSEYDAQGACPNDNGSPLVIIEKLTETLIGLVSFISAKGCTLGHPTGYVRIGPYVNWITKNTEFIP